MTWKDKFKMCVCVGGFGCRGAQNLKTQQTLIVFFNNSMHKFFILIHLLYSCTCFEHYCAHPQEDNCFSTALQVTCGPNSHLKIVTIPNSVVIQLSPHSARNI